MLLLLLLLLLPATTAAGNNAGGGDAICATHSNTSCAECTQAADCDWCERTLVCANKLDVLATCSDTWIGNGDDCWLLDAMKDDCYGPQEGCTNLYAINYKFRASKDDGSCIYKKGYYDLDQVCATTCACEHQGGFLRKYGKFCALDYSGCPGQQPCDALDLCCQIHDHCISQEGAPACECGNMLHNCVAALNETDFEGKCPYMKETANLMLAETGAQLLFECLARHDLAPKCEADVNCNGIGECLYNGSCTCPPNGHWQYDSFGRTGCECAPGWYPYCGPDACTHYCNSDVTCSSHGTCSENGGCTCDAGYPDCSTNAEPRF
eukprot:TRINITY_DN3306_c0_g1_i1.p1 TRINITY_DN3306_c0_g1~~TRINITY_DN3306_c0_g1_i1.p1  ORF type:complete len:349 (+),score=79.14 TRINITY_DN3306_c0_g1_i1:79-1047(+)